MNQNNPAKISKKVIQKICRKKKIYIGKNSKDPKKENVGINAYTVL